MEINIIFPQLLLQICFLTVVFLHITKKNLNAVIAYIIQSLAIILLLVNSFFETGNMSVLYSSLLLFTVKIVVAPIFFTSLIRKNKLIFSASTYLNAPLTLLSIAALTTIAYSYKLATLTSIIPANKEFLSLALAAMFSSLFLIVNRKGVLSQIIGILSLENSIVAFSIFAGLEQSFSLQIGILFDLAIWSLIATAFSFMIYSHFGSFDVTTMKKLKD